MVWLLVGALGVLIAEEFALTATQKGLLVGVPLLGGALLRIPVGMSADRFGPKPVGLALLICELLTVLAGWLAGTTYLQMLRRWPCSRLCRCQLRCRASFSQSRCKSAGTSGSGYGCGCFRK